MEYCHFSKSEAWDLPVVYRKWFIARKDKENKAVAEAEKKARDAAGRRSAPPRPPPKRPPKR